MTTPLRGALVMVVMLASGVVAGQQPATNSTPAQPGQARFRGGANLVRVDAYVTVNRNPVTDLTLQDFEVLEDNVPQRVESFQLVNPRGPAPVSELAEPNSVAESRDMARDPEARVFVLFMDLWHVQIAGSYHAQAPITRLLDRVIGQDDLVGVMHPEMSARNLTLGRRTASIAGILKDHWHWGQRDRINTVDPREREIESCYPDHDDTVGFAAKMIARRREGKTLDALEDTIVHLEGIREERKFVVLLSEGWLMPPPDQSLARAWKKADGSSVIPGGPVPMGTDAAGKLRIGIDRGQGDLASCERERSLLAHSDHQSRFQQLLMRANRANVSFYPVDARGLVPFDEPIGPNRPPPPSVDAARLSTRRETLRTLALVTDGHAIVDTNAIDKSLERMVQDTGAYYLLGYYSTNTRLDGRFRKLTVRVKRSDVEVRARPGYLAPSEADLASARVDALMNGAAPGHTTIPPTISRAFDSLAPARGNVPLRVHTTSAAGQIWLTGELDQAIAKSVEWQTGGQLRVVFEHERGNAIVSQVVAPLEPGQRAFTVTPPSGTTLAPGRYVVRVELMPTGSTLPFQTTADVTVPEADWLVGYTGLATRRGPSTGLQYLPTADARFRRTERLRVEVPRAPGEGTVTARVLGRDGQPLGIAVGLSERSDAASQQRLILADLTLAPMAQGDYVLEVMVERGERKESATYAFRIVP